MCLRLHFPNTLDRRPTPAKKTPPVLVSSTQQIRQESTSMSDRTPQCQTTSRCGLRRMSAALVLAAAVLVTACEPVTRDGTDPATVDGPSQATAEVEFTALCDETGFAYNIEPNTPEARGAAREWCESTDAALENLPWPSGFRPIGPVAVDR